MSLKARINDDLKAAMRGGDARRRDALRLLLAALKQREVDERKELADAEVVAIVEKLIKQRRESITQFEKGGRQDLAQNEKFELDDAADLHAAGACRRRNRSRCSRGDCGSRRQGPSDMGKVMGALKGKLAGRADMGKVSALVKTKLAG